MVAAQPQQPLLGEKSSPLLLLIPNRLWDRLGIAWKITFSSPGPFHVKRHVKRHVEVSRSQVLSESASSFRRDAEQLRRLVWWGNVKKVLIMGLIVVPETAWL